MPLLDLSPEAKAVLATKTIVPVVGITAVGKNTLMDAAAAADPNFHRVSGFTTRARRPHEPADTYREFVRDTVEARNALFEATGENELVQYAQHPKTHDLYGTQLRDYEAAYNLKDTLSGEPVETYRQLGFAACRVVVVVAPLSMWRARFAAHITSPSEAKARCAEANGSLHWSLEQGDQVEWLNNPDKKLLETTERFIAIAQGEPNPEHRLARKIGIELLKHLQT